MALPTIGDQGRLLVRRMAARKWGVTIAEVQERLGVSYWAARRFLLKLVGEGVVKKTGERRRRTEIFEKVHGPGGDVFRARKLPLPEDAEWYGSRSWRHRSRARGQVG